jgi:hypothetical protein
MAAVDVAEDRGPFAFGEKILNLLDQGRFTSTYKYAVLLSLVDLCLENPKADGSAPDVLTTAQIAEKIVETYWPHTSPFAGHSKTKVLAQNAGGQAEILSAIARFRASYKADPSELLSRARARNPRRFEALLRFVEWKLIEMPLPLQGVGNTEDQFLYDMGWKGDTRQRDVGNPGFDATSALSAALAITSSVDDVAVHARDHARPLPFASKNFSSARSASRPTRYESR